jgi:hypothetical protein
MSAYNTLSSSHVDMMHALDHVHSVTSRCRGLRGICSSPLPSPSSPLSNHIEGDSHAITGLRTMHNYNNELDLVKAQSFSSTLYSHGSRSLTEVCKESQVVVYHSSNKIAGTRTEWMNQCTLLYTPQAWQLYTLLTPPVLARLSV